jgi:hypothetical protein
MRGGPNKKKLISAAAVAAVDDDDPWCGAMKKNGVSAGGSEDARTFFLLQIVVLEVSFGFVKTISSRYMTRGAALYAMTRARSPALVFRFLPIFVVAASVCAVSML